MNRRSLGDALEKALTNLIEQRRKQPKPCGAVEIPLLGAVAIYTDADVKDAGYAIVRALERQAQWDKEKPPVGLPTLPIGQTEIAELINARGKFEDILLTMLGYYARSLRLAWWDRKHPGFEEFLAGLLASPECPLAFKINPVLKTFQGEPLIGFNDEIDVPAREVTFRAKGGRFAEKAFARCPLSGLSHEQIGSS
jgi:hypothetical protein